MAKTVFCWPYRSTKVPIEPRALIRQHAYECQIRGGESSWTLVRQIKHWSGKIAKEAQIFILK